jgi:RNA polymerase sigma-70 factor, ECF subfamily
MVWSSKSVARGRVGSRSVAPSDADHVARPAASTPEPIDDEALIRAAQDGDLTAFNALVTRHQRAVFSVCLRLLRDVQIAEDATQDTFVRAWQAIDTFRGGLARPWLLRIATNRAYDLLRARARRPADSLDAELYEVEPDWTSQAPAAEDPEIFAARTELSGELETALGRLPEDQRLAIILADVQGYGYEEIASITGVAVGTVKSRISRGRARLRVILNEDERSRELFARYVRLSSQADDA